jgi:7-cyano-7-deazaguanine synthase
MNANPEKEKNDELAAKMDVLVLLSGGTDSTALVHFYKTRGNNVSGLFIDFGQISGKREGDASELIANFYKIKLHKLKCSSINTWKSGYIPGRNAFLLHTALMNFPSKKGIIAIGIHSGTNYVDCDHSFAIMMQQSFDLYTDGQVNLGTPFIDWKKNEIYKYSQLNGIPLHLTYSCELGKEQPCGECNSCKDLEALNAQR